LLKAKKADIPAFFRYLFSSAFSGSSKNPPRERAALPADDNLIPKSANAVFGPFHKIDFVPRDASWARLQPSAREYWRRFSFLLTRSGIFLPVLEFMKRTRR
jgi:hypothetical protein